MCIANPADVDDFRVLTIVQCLFLVLVTLCISPDDRSASIVLFIPPAVAAASYTKATLGADWALIQALTKESSLPSVVSIGMFRICYSSPSTACLAFQWGLKMGA